MDFLWTFFFNLFLDRLLVGVGYQIQCECERLGRAIKQVFRAKNSFGSEQG